MYEKNIINEYIIQNLLSARTAAATANSLLASHAGFDDEDDDTRSFLKKVRNI